MNQSQTFSRAWAIACRAPDTHPFVVAGEVLRQVQEYEQPFVIALLHDAIEDGYATEEEIKENFPWEISDAVRELTRAEGEGYWDYIKRLRYFGPSSAQVVKIADATVNLRRCIASENWSLARRYERVLEIFEVPTEVESV